RLIKQRRAHSALATGKLLPVSANKPPVAAYLRRTGDHAVLVVANLGATPASDVSIPSRESVLSPGRYTPRNLLGGPKGTTLEVNRDGRIQGYVPAGTLGSRERLILDLNRP